MLAGISQNTRMANNLSIEKQVAVVNALAEGNAIRAIERMTGIHRDTVMRLGIRAGENCAKIMDREMRNLNCRVLQMDEIWGFIGKKRTNTSPSDRANGLGDCWTFVCIDAETRMVPAFHVGQRDSWNADIFCEDVASRMTEHVQISTDALIAYAGAIGREFGAQADHGQIVKVYGTDDLNGARRYSPPKLIEVRKSIVSGNPNMDLVSTSYIERQNLTMRMHMRRLTRLTNAFSKKRENFKAAVALHFGYYNFVRSHKTLRMTPAMAGGVTDHAWTIEELITG